MSSAITKLLRAMKMLGPLSGILYVVDQLMIRSNSRFRIFYYDIAMQPVRNQPLLPKSRGKRFITRNVAKEDPVLKEIPPAPPVIQSRFEQGAICLGTFRGEHLIGYLWVRIGEYEEDEVRVTFRPHPIGHTAFDFDVYVFPKHRFGLGFAAMWDGANEFLSDRGIRYTFSRISRYNSESLKSHAKLNSIAVGRAIFLCGKKNQLMLSSLKPYFHFSRKPQDRPVMHIFAPGS